MEAMKERHQKEADELQKSCKHPEEQWTDWIEEWWAMGHPTGFMIKTCKHCEKEVDRKGWCRGCNKEMVGRKWHEGDGSSFACSVNCIYCDDCYRPDMHIDGGLCEEGQKLWKLVTDSFDEQGVITRYDKYREHIKKCSECQVSEEIE